MIGPIIIFLAVLSLLVLVHELGHLLVAKKCGVWVEEFGLGLPPRLIGKKIGGTVYSLNLLPFGGFCRLHGEGSEAGISKPNQDFLNKRKLVRAAIVTAGVVMNFLLGVVAFALVYTFSGIPRESNQVRLVDIASDSPAQAAGLLVGDTVTSVNGEKVATVDQFVALIEKNKGKKVVLQTLDRQFSLTPRESPPRNEGPLGVTLSTTEIYYPPLLARPLYGIYYGFRDALYWGKMVIAGFAALFTQLFMGQVPTDVAGPVGVFAITTEAAKFGALALVNFIGILSVNLAILNILPFPALDGGRLLFIGIEGLIGRKVMPRLEAVIHTVGMIILLLVVLAVTARDIERLIRAGSLSNFIQSVLK